MSLPLDSFRLSSLSVPPDDPQTLLPVPGKYPDIERRKQGYFRDTSGIFHEPSRDIPPFFQCVYLPCVPAHFSWGEDAYSSTVLHTRTPFPNLASSRSSTGFYAHHLYKHCTTQHICGRHKLPKGSFRWQYLGSPMMEQNQVGQKNSSVFVGQKISSLAVLSCKN